MVNAGIEMFVGIVSFIFLPNTCDNTNVEHKTHNGNKVLILHQFGIIKNQPLGICIQVA